VAAVHVEQASHACLNCDFAAQKALLKFLSSNDDEWMKEFMEWEAN
jgi:hypothetical protein